MAFEIDPQGLGVESPMCFYQCYYINLPLQAVHCPEWISAKPIGFLSELFEECHGSRDVICPVDISFCAAFEYSFNDFGKALSSLGSRDIGWQVLHAARETENIFHRGGMRKVSKHGLVVRGVAAE